MSSNETNTQVTGEPSHIAVDVPPTPERLPMTRTYSQSPADLDKFETQSVHEKVAPYKHEGPWYKDTTKKRLLGFSIIALIIIILISQCRSPRQLRTNKKVFFGKLL
ncbi:2564_t:CDS:2 [Ambispora gerdemannii]|uniref:2564_t:CDS:1 n=1 Tax=Ambispora gerdemannii TaxID=144530 RepID=A0A9N8ZKH0_9GLOM|nr:2564_t:CDS:2 [Ambispora gerdemannii]